MLAVYEWIYCKEFFKLFQFQIKLKRMKFQQLLSKSNQKRKKKIMGQQISINWITKVVSRTVMIEKWEHLKNNLSSLLLRSAMTQWQQTSNQFELELICVKWSCLPLSVLIKLWVLCFNDYVRWFVNSIRKKKNALQTV